ncbi:MAG: hypothetical protein GF355_00170 [Candidatus Eisenbacteria bacterium]|nr:hypothetical protein [Candidatus Eisenbacteria bacterium]
MKVAKSMMFGAIVLAVFATGWTASEMDQEPPEGGKWIQVYPWYRTIVVMTDGGSTYVYPDTLRMKNTDQVRWINPPGREFEIQFENADFPFGAARLVTDEAKEYRSPVSDTPAGDYKYAVIFGKDTLDPIIRIEEDPPPGGDSAGVSPKQ